jgi:flagellar motility protein MotE (MotC chaperone)
MTAEKNPKPRKSRRLRRSGPGVLVLIAGFMFASGLIRLGDGTGAAIAREIGALVNAASAAPPGHAEDAPGLDELLAAVRAREQRVAEAEARLAEREQVLAVAQEEVDRGLQAMSEAQASLEGLLTVADTAAEADIARLTAMYEAMKPADAAALFEQMDPGFAAGFLGRMRADAAGAVLAGLPPEKAYMLSVVLAGRNATVASE